MGQTIDLLEEEDTTVTADGKVMGPTFLLPYY
jgi:hypothetical protein